MADAKAVSIVPLSGTNYPTWKVQCRMALIREGQWGIVTGTEECPDSATDADKHVKYMAQIFLVEKMGQKSIGGVEYILTLLDDMTHYGCTHYGCTH